MIVKLTKSVDGDQTLDGGRGRELDEGKEDNLHCGLRHEGSKHALKVKAKVKKYKFGLKWSYESYQKLLLRIIFK